MNLAEYQKFVEYQKSKGKNANKVWQKLSYMSINIVLDLKARLVWEKKKRIITSEISSISMQWSLKCGVVFFGEWYFSSRLRWFSFHDVY